ncbi:hypothetical protein Dimus_017695 [Dionaea muscipula]
MKRTKVTDLTETSSRQAAYSQQTQEEDITEFDPLDHPSLTLARLWPKFEYFPIVCGRSIVLDAQYHFLLNDFVNGMGWGSLLSLPDKFYPIVVRHFYCNLTWTNGRHGIELHSYFLSHRLKITRPLLARWIGVDLCDNKTYFVLDKINARASQVDVNPDDVNEVVDELMNDVRGNANAPRQDFSSAMTPQVFADYHREIMEGIQALQTLGFAYTNQLRGIATTQNLHERRISGLERDMRCIRGTTDRIKRHLLGLPAEPVPPPAHPSRPRNLGSDYDSGNGSDLE